MEEKYLTVRSAVLVPALQAVLTGIFIGGAIGGIVWILNILGKIDVPAWAVGFTVGFLACVRAWTALLGDWKKMLYGLDPEIQPVVEQQIVRVELSSNQGRTMQFLDLPADASQLIQLGTGITQGKGFTEAQWTGRGAPFSRNEFVQLRAELISRGFLMWNSPNDPARGVRVTGKGQAIMRQFASMADSPTLKLIDTKSR